MRRKFDLHRFTQLQVESPERLIHQQNALGRISHGACHRDTLRLTATEFRRIAFPNIGKMDQIEQFAHPLARLLLAGTPLFETKADVVLNRHVREQGIILEDHADFPFLRGNERHVIVAEIDRTLA